MNKKSEGDLILKEHEELGKLLQSIPKKREVQFEEEFKGENWFGKPRFYPKHYHFDPKLLARIKNHLQSIWCFFDKYSYWFDSSIYSLIAWEVRRTSKKSIIFLLEKDIWETDEVYGKYHIDIGTNETKISYWRRGNFFNTQIIQTTKRENIINFIKRDAVEQVINQFLFLWEKLESEIISCIEDKYTKKEKISIKPDYIKEQIIICDKLLEQYPEMVLLNIGRIAEYILLIKLRQNQRNYNDDLVNLAYNAKKINNKEKKCFSNIRKEYNHLKHNINYLPNLDIIKEFLEFLKNNI